MKNEGFILPMVLIVLAAFAIAIEVNLSSTDIDNKMIGNRRLTSTRNNLLLQVRKYASMGSALRYSATSLNPALLSCVNGTSCTGGGPYPLYLASPILSSSGTPVNIGGPSPGVTYDPWGKKALVVILKTSESAACPIAVITQYWIMCRDHHPVLRALLLFRWVIPFKRPQVRLIQVSFRRYLRRHPSLFRRPYRFWWVHYCAVVIAWPDLLLSSRRGKTWISR